MGGLAPGQLKSRRGWHSSPRRLHYRFSFFDRVSRTHCGKNSINFPGMAHSHRHRLAAAWPSLVRQIGPVLRRRRQANGWLGVAQIWVSGLHIIQGTVKLNDTYFNTSTYNKPEWRNLVMCQEVGHTFGLDHQDTNFSNTNLGTCMDYTSNPLGPPDNEHPNQHDYDELVTIYNHLDSTTTVGTAQTIRMPPAMTDIEL